MISINKNLSIPNSEISFRFSGASKPGGQHVNRSNTRVTLIFDVENSAALSEEDRGRIREKLGQRINKDGVLQVACQSYRSQRRNRIEAMKLFARLVRGALERVPKRKRTVKTRGSQERRLQKKKHRGRIKKLRKRIDPRSKKYDY